MIRTLALLSVVLLMLGCAAGKPVPEDHFYRLSPVSDGEALAVPLSEGVIEVERISAFSLYHERAVLYTTAGEPNRLLRHHYEHWADTPVNIIRDHFVDYLRARNAAGLVAGAAEEARGDLRIELELRGFERMLNSGGAVNARIEIAAVVRRPGDARPLLLESYQVSIPAASQSMTDSVQAFSSGLEQIYGALLKDLAEALAADKRQG